MLLRGVRPVAKRAHLVAKRAHLVAKRAYLVAKRVREGVDLLPLHHGVIHGAVYSVQLCEGKTITWDWLISAIDWTHQTTEEGEGRGGRGEGEGRRREGEGREERRREEREERRGKRGEGKEGGEKDREEEGKKEREGKVSRWRGIGVRMKLKKKREGGRG